VKAAVGTPMTDIYEAVIALSRSIAGRSDPESLLSGVGERMLPLKPEFRVTQLLADTLGAGRAEILTPAVQLADPD
jgi:hypothetical protein